MRRIAVIVALGLAAAAPARAETDPPRAPAAPAAGEPAGEDAPREKTTDKAEAERVLRSRGLRRDGRVYVLRREEDLPPLFDAMTLATREADGAASAMAQREAEAVQVRSAIVGLSRQYSLTLGASVAAVAAARTAQAQTQTSSSDSQADARAAGARRGDLEAQAAARAAEAAALAAEITRLQANLVRIKIDYDRLGLFVAAKQAEYARDEAAAARMIESLRREYADLANDSSVKDALAALNRGSDTRLALGPREDYRANLRDLAARLLKDRGFQGRKGGGLSLAADADVRTAMFLVETIRGELAAALAREQNLRRESDFRARRLADLEARGAGQPGAEPARLRQEQAEADKALKGLAQEIASQREALVQGAQALRKAVDRSRGKHQEVRDDNEVKRLLADLKGKRARNGRGTPARKGGAAAPPGEALLDEVERSIRTETIPLTPDRVAPWVVATVNDVPGRKLVVDPTADTVRVSQRFAASVGLDTPSAPGPPVVTVTMPDGQTLPARRATLRSVRVGGFTRRDVPCLVLLGGYEGPALLGASFLDHYLTRLDADAGTLTLTEVDVKPRAARASATKTSSPRPKRP